MTPKTQRQLVLLAGLIVIAIVLWMRPDGDAPTGTAARTSNQTVPEGTAAGETVAVPDVRLEQLALEPPAVARPARNPFRFRPAPPPPPAPVAAQPPPQFDQPTAVFTQPPPPQVPPIPLHFMGLYDRDGLIGVFVGTPPGQGNVFHAKAGDVILGQYRVLRLGRESAEVAHLDGSGRQTIRISGQ